VKSTKTAWLALHLAPSIGAVTFWKLIDYFTGADAALRAPRRELERAGLSPQQCDILSNPNQLLSLAETECDRLRQFGGDCLCAFDQAFPALLKQLSDCPPVLFTAGRTELLHASCIGMVGSRASTAYGRRVAARLGSELASAGATVVSGMALGIDGEAHKAALDTTGASIGVLGCGLDTVYPRQHASLYAAMRERGLLITEYPFGTKPEAFRFPARNRIIAGLSSGVIVVEAAKKSGSLITAQMAIDVGREVFAVPGQVDSYKSEGCHWLLKQGATLVQTGVDVLDQLQWQHVSFFSASAPKQKNEKSSQYTENQELVLDHIDVYSTPRDELVAKTQLNIQKINEILLLLEIDGMIEMLPGDAVRRVR